MKQLLFVFLMGLFAQNVGAVVAPTVSVSVISPTVKESKAKTYLKAVSKGEKSGVVAVILCLLLGSIGVHRVYMGSKPVMVLWYLLTVGGVFGLLPLIDFFRLLFGGAKHYDGNDRLFAAFG